MLLNAFRLKPDCRALAVETAMQLTEDGSDGQWLALYDSLSPELRACGRLRLLRAVALLHLGRLEEAAEILNRAFVMPDVKEGELSVSYLWFELYRRLYAKEQGVPWRTKRCFGRRMKNTPCPRRWTFGCTDSP